VSLIVDRVKDLRLRGGNVDLGLALLRSRGCERSRTRRDRSLCCAYQYLMMGQKKGLDAFTSSRTYRADSTGLPLRRGLRECLELEVEGGLVVAQPLYHQVGQRLVVVGNRKIDRSFCRGGRGKGKSRVCGRGGRKGVE